MVSLLTSDEYSNEKNGISNVASSVYQTAIVQTKPNTVVAKLALVHSFTDEKIVLLNEVIASIVHVAGFSKKDKKF